MDSGPAWVSMASRSRSTGNRWVISSFSRSRPEAIRAAARLWVSGLTKEPRMVSYFW